MAGGLKNKEVDEKIGKRGDIKRGDRGKKKNLNFIIS
jgi:hypothetical protein